MVFVEPGDPDALAAAAREELSSTLGASAAVVGRAPGRVNLIGEHTDYNAGLVLPIALNHATYAAVAPRDDGRLRLASRQERGTWESQVDDAVPGSVTGWPAYVAGVVWALRQEGVDVPGLDVAVDTSVPVGAGLSSSAALECAVAVALASLLDLPLDTAGRRTLAAACRRAESDVVNAPTGGMDQTVSMLAEAGSALLIDFDDDETATVPFDLAAGGLALLVTDTRVSHTLAEGGGYGDRRAECDEAARQLGVSTLRHAGLADVEELGDNLMRRRARHVVTEITRVERAVSAIEAGDWARLGRLFGESHLSMRDDFEISCAELDTAVATAVEAGAIGARMTGGGFGGSSIALVPVERVDAVVRAIDTAFVAGGYTAPAHLLAEPAAAADVVTT
jgi:galactokinase